MWSHHYVAGIFTNVGDAALVQQRNFYRMAASVPSGQHYEAEGDNILHTSSPLVRCVGTVLLPGDELNRWSGRIPYWLQRRSFRHS
jgi:hypothetical protein